jgi:hypothetical protein
MISFSYNCIKIFDLCIRDGWSILVIDIGLVIIVVKIEIILFISVLVGIRLLWGILEDFVGGRKVGVWVDC